MRTCLSAGSTLWRKKTVKIRFSFLFLPVCMVYNYVLSSDCLQSPVTVIACMTKRKDLFSKYHRLQHVNDSILSHWWTAAFHFWSVISHVNIIHKLSISQPYCTAHVPSGVFILKQGFKGWSPLLCCLHGPVWTSLTWRKRKSSISGWSHKKDSDL